MWRRWGTPQNFCLAFIDELEKQLFIKKNCWGGLIKNVRILIFKMFFFKIKKHIWILLFYTCIIILNLDDMIYSSWDIECDGLKLVIMGHFLPFYTLWSEADWIFIILGHFLHFTPPPLTTQKIKILKKWKKGSRDAIIQYTWCVPKIMIIWGMLPEIWSVTDIIFCHFGPFFALLSH